MSQSPQHATPSHEQIEALIREVMLPFHMIARDAQLPLDKPRKENDAEHSWSVAVLAACLAAQIDPTLDVGKICQLAIVHDLVEVFAGDTSVFDTTPNAATKAERERAAFMELRDRFAVFPWLIETIQEYEEKASKEAVFVCAIDKYVPLHYDHLDKGAYLKRRRITKHQYDQSLVKPNQKARLHSGVAKYYDHLLDIINEHPEYFYQP